MRELIGVKVERWLDRPIACLEPAFMMTSPKSGASLDASLSRL
jgi:hypothetical protein